MGYTHPRLCPNRNKSCALSTAVYVSALSEYLKFQTTRSQFIYIGPPISTCADIIDISGETDTVYVLSCQSSHVYAVLTHVL